MESTENQRVMEICWIHRPNERQWTDHKRHREAYKGRMISWKTKELLETKHCGTTGRGMDKNSKGQRKLQDSGGGLPPAVE